MSRREVTLSILGIQRYKHRTEYLEGDSDSIQWDGRRVKPTTAEDTRTKNIEKFNLIHIKIHSLSFLETNHNQYYLRVYLWIFKISANLSNLRSDN